MVRHSCSGPPHGAEANALPLFLLALKRTDSSSDSTRRKDSTVSKVSEHESKAEVKAAVPESPRTAVPESPLFDVPGEDERLEEDMPWLKVVARVANGFNFYCTHQGFCHPCCFRRQMRASKRIMVAARRVSGRSVGHCRVAMSRSLNISIQIYGEEVEYTEDIFSDGHGAGSHVHHHSGGGRSVDAGGGGGGHDPADSQYSKNLGGAGGGGRNSAGAKMNVATPAGESNGTSSDKTKGGGRGWFLHHNFSGQYLVVLVALLYLVLVVKEKRRN